MPTEPTPPLEPMRGLAVRFCALVEEPGTDRLSFLREVAALLAELIAAAIRLPPIEVLSSDVRRGVSTDAWEERYHGVGAVLSGWDGYWTELEPFRDDTGEVGFGSLTDDLTDIWRDLKEGLVALDAGEPEHEVIWSWRFAFWTHWGEHATAALQVLQARLADVTQS
jgi:hypothetical protein